MAKISQDNFGLNWLKSD